MKTQLLKNLIMVVAFFATITMSAQQGPTLYDFSDGAQGWVKGYGVGTVAHDPVEGETGDGALSLDRLQTNNNANVRRGQGGDDAFIVIDRGVYNFVRIKYKNELAATSFRLQGNSRPSGGTGLGDPITNIVVNGISNLSSTYSEVFVDITSIPAGNEVTRFDILVRGEATSDPSGALIYFDEIEFLETVPDTSTYSEFIKNPSFEDPDGLAQYSGASAGASRALTTSEFHDGTQSLGYTL